MTVAYDGSLFQYSVFLAPASDGAAEVCKGFQNSAILKTLFTDKLRKPLPVNSKGHCAVDMPTSHSGLHALMSFVSVQCTNDDHCH